MEGSLSLRQTGGLPHVPLRAGGDVNMTFEPPGPTLRVTAIRPSRGRVFLAKPGRARYQVRAFSAPLLNALHGPPQ
jgi:hypothetical protein